MKLLILVAMAAAAVQAAPEQAHCNARCKDQKEGDSLIDACQRGCVVFLAKDAAERNIFVNPFTALQRSDNRAALIKCTNDCNLSYHDSEASSCADGCRWQSETTASASRGTVLNFGDGGLTITLGGMPDMPRMPEGLSNLFSQVNDMVNDQIRVQHGRVQSILGASDPAEVPAVAPKMDNASGNNVFGDMFTSMHNMMRGFLPAFGEMPEETRDQDGKLVHGGGELVVIKSGPGYHSEKTYKLGPDADIEKILDNNMNDMLNHKNPMEKYMNNDQVEVFAAPAEQANEVAAEVVRVADSDPWGIINEGLEGPRLPETGLKSRHYEVAVEEPRGPSQEDLLNKKIEEVFGSHHQPRFIYVDRDICAQEYENNNTRQLSWGEWFDCLHVRMGLPNWLLVSTVALGVIFTLWLCLVIPSNPPKQKVRTPKNVHVKELEANGAVATIIMPPTNELEKVDLPPSYDDLMITSELKKKALDAEEDDGFSAKLVLEDDEEIVEPLPQKANESNA